jgi:hypothetical protein
MRSYTASATSSAAGDATFLPSHSNSHADPRSTVTGGGLRQTGIGTKRGRSAFGWGDEHLHRFVVHGTEYGVDHLGGPFRDDARRVRLAELGLRITERFTYHYNFTAGWEVNLCLEQMASVAPGRSYPRCTGGRRAGPAEDWAGPLDYLERTQPYLVFDAMLHAADIIGRLLDADDEDDLASVGVHQHELAAPAPLLGLERFDRRARSTTPWRHCPRPG